MPDKKHTTTSSQVNEDAKDSAQLELEIARPLNRLQESSGNPVFVVDELFNVVAFANGARSILGSTRSTDFSLLDCDSLSPEQQARLTEEVRKVLVSEDPKLQRFLRLEVEGENGARVFCLTFEKEALCGGRDGVRCTAEPLLAKSPPHSPPAITKGAEEAIIGWTFDKDTKVFEHFGNDDVGEMGNVHLSEWLTCVSENERSLVENAFSDILEGDASEINIQYRVTLATGVTRKVSTLAKWAPATNGQSPSALIGMHQYNFDNQSVVEDLKLFSYLARKVQLSILVYDQFGNISWCNNAFSECTGYKFEDIVGRDPNDLLRGPLTETSSVRHMRDRIRKGKAFHAELVQYKKNGAPYWVSIDGNPLVDDSGKVTRFISFQTDITETKKTQSAILRSEIKFRSLFDNSTDALLLLSPKDGVIIEANMSSFKLLDTERLVGQRFEEIFPEHPDFRVDHLNTLIDENNGHQRHSAEFITTSGQVRPVEMTVSRTPIGESIALFVTLRDVSEKRLLEEQLRHTQRMEAVGRLAGGIAHDFNNLLAGQRGFSELLCNSRDLSKKDHVYANEILKITDRASKLTSRLLSFSRGKSDRPVVANLNELIGNMMPMLSRILKKEVRFTSQLDPSLSNVKVDTNQIDQVIMNLVVNGQEAITSHDGVVTLKTSMIQLTGAEIFITGKPKPGKYAKVTVRDNGQGIHRDVLEKIFEPFFTTKKGAGTGLGLSIVYGIIQSNGGHLMVDSEIGSGTEFSFYFPEVLEEVKREDSPDLLERMPSAESSKSGATPTILVAEDQEQVREILELGLGQSGYNLVIAKDGLEAIEKGKNYDGTIDLLLTDSIMPGASGATVVKEMQKAYPDIKIVLMSGLPQQESVECQELEIDAYVDKPFSIRKLLELIQDLVAVPKN
ncbi:PAS domain S-box protein [Pelagicoccus sp. SDUM812005]|uniref:PAS domain-containing hybrid sensor histidine kinase/response regulator n=1 Tax=Pelagicoccus sp. SDUM812005 TaxID=3041257 RepID=UPI00280E847E|nr:PAS domain S-box protein [Pelagicoccus sp. SDUM812005]MDQ8182908.1 PAS domain S-box protein [Pelagicoccus sp. SDUM812005]